MKLPSAATGLPPAAVDGGDPDVVEKEQRRLLATVAADLGWLLYLWSSELDVLGLCAGADLAANSGYQYAGLTSSSDIQRRARSLTESRVQRLEDLRLRQLLAACFRTHGDS
jgi:hypothetical protein